MKKYTQILESNNIDYYNKMKLLLDEIKSFEKIILEYISYKTDNNISGLYIDQINIVEDEIRIVTYSDNEQYNSYYIGDNEKENFNKFLNDPEVYKNTKKYNL